MYNKARLIVTILGLYSQCQAEANVAVRTGAMVQRSMQKIQQNAPLINSRLETTQLVFQKAKAGYKFFQRMKEIIKNKKEENARSENTQKSDLTDLMRQIQRCVPDGDKDQQCYSPCTKEGNTKYRWCYTSSEHRTNKWLACSCTIKKEVLEYLDVARQNILKTPPTPWTYLEITMVAIASSLGVILALFGSLVGYAYFRRTQEDPFQVPGVGNIHANPIFHPENDQ